MVDGITRSPSPMPVVPPFPTRLLPNSKPILRDVALRTGVYVGLGLSVILVLWIFLANRVPFLDKFAMERNLAAAISLALVALIPIVRFLRLPARLWISSLVGWSIFSVSYALLSLVFGGLHEHFGAFQIFILGG